MGILDIIILIPTFWFLIKGYRQGILLEFISLLAILFGVVGCITLGHTLNSMLDRWVGSSQVSTLFIYVITFLILFFLIILLGRLLEKTLKLTGLNFFNRFAGSVFGALKVLFLFSAFFWLISFTTFENKGIYAESFLYSAIKPMAPAVINLSQTLMPGFESLVDEIEVFFEGIRLKIEENK